MFFQEREDISSFRGIVGERVETRIVGPLFFLTEGANFSCFLGRGSILICGVGRFTRMLSDSVSSSVRTAYLLFDDLICTAGQLVSTVQTENPIQSPFLLGPSLLSKHQTFLH